MTVELPGSALPESLHQALTLAPQQQIPFVQFMELALYDPAWGYYSRVASPIGRQGDFLTSPHLAPDFGELAAIQVEQMWQALGQPDPFGVVEMGAGQGVMAADLIRYCHTRFPDLFQALSYTIIERSETRKTQQQQHLQAWVDLGTVQWLAWDDLEKVPIMGVCLANELVDAFPVHRVQLRQGQLQEIYVAWNPDQQQLEERLGPLSTPALQAYFQPLGIDLTTPPYPDPYTTEVNLAAPQWLKQVAAILKRGFLVTIDYGYPAATYYHPNRSDGTLQCYYQHHHHHNPYRYLGQQDLTAHVDFTTLQLWGEKLGLATLGFTHQGIWLMALGLGERLAANNQSNFSLETALPRRDRLQQLINPLGLGGLRVLIQGKGENLALEHLKSLKVLTGSDVDSRLY